MLTYIISSAFGYTKSIPFYRVVQFSYVTCASIVATSLCDLLARRHLSAVEYRHRFLWMAAWWPFLFLVTTDPRFNLYNHSLHNDGLALLISVVAFWILVKHSITPRPWHLGIMTILPAFGFLVKQSLLIWVAIFSIYLLVTKIITWKRFIVYLLSSTVSVGIIIAIFYFLLGKDFIFWIFSALGKKEVSLLRDLRNLFDAGIYASMGLFGGLVLVLRNGTRTSLVLWLCWLFVFATAVYTSGIGFQRNHFGPGIVIGSCWFFVALVKVWPSDRVKYSRWQLGIQSAVAVCIVVLFFGALGLVREPRNPIPEDFYRYVNDIEKEFAGFDSDKVLMDVGTWIYLRDGVLMKDRSAPISIHVGKNQPEISRQMLSETIKRIEAKTYEKILARQLDTGHTWYDFQDRGSGVKVAILDNYRELRRIPAVQGIEQWWPTHLVAEILVLVPKQEQQNSPSL